MVVSGVEREGNVLIHAAALRPVPVLPPNHGALHRNNRDSSLVRGWIITVTIQSPCGLRLIETAVRIIGLHGVALFGTDAECLHHKFIAACFSYIKCIQRICHFPVLPCGRFLRRMRARPFAERHEHSLVIVTGKGSRFIILNQRAFPSISTSGTDFQRLWRFHHEGLVVPAHAIGGVDCGRGLQRPRVPRILRVVLEHCLLQHTRGMVRLRP